MRKKAQMNKLLFTQSINVQIREKYNVCRQKMGRLYQYIFRDGYIRF